MNAGETITEQIYKNKGAGNKNAYVDSDDTIYLLYHTLLPERFPLRAKM